jgi:hypothetical protein
MSFRILHSEFGWPHKDTLPDVYFEYSYVKLTAQIENGQPQAAYLQTTNGSVFFPYIVRSISNDFCDIITPYGYGGVITDNRDLLPVIYKHFFNHCIENKIVTQTIRYNPLLKNQQFADSNITLQYIRKTVGIDLRAPLINLVSGYETNVRSRIKQAYNHDIVIKKSNNKEEIHQFIRLYYLTMDRNNANKWYYFTEKYFFDLCECDFVHLFVAIYQERIIAATIILTSKYFGHYHLAASDNNYINLHPNHLLIHEVAEWLKSEGKKIFHLGGGLNENDNLFKFKKSFSNKLFFDFYLGRSIFLQNEYDTLVEQRSQPISETEFFPAYRSR